MHPLALPEWIDPRARTMTAAGAAAACAPPLIADTSSSLFAAILSNLGVSGESQPRGARQPIEPDPDHAGGGSLRCAPSDLAADATLACHCGRCAAASARARPRVHCITNAVAQNFTPNLLLAAGAAPSMTIAPDEIAAFIAARRRAAGQSRHPRRRSAHRDRSRGRGGRGERVPWSARSGAGRPLATARRARERQLVARHCPRAIRLNGAEFSALAEAAAGAAMRWRALRRGAGHRGRAHGRSRRRRRRRAHGRDSQRRSADGQGDRHGLRRLGAGRRVPRGRARCVARDRGRPGHHRRGGRGRGRACAGPGHVRGRRPRCGCTDPDAARPSCRAREAGREIA